MPDKPSGFGQCWQELKRRKVLGVITVYAAVAFVILQLAEILVPSLGLPDWTIKFILVVLIVGFIIAIILSWIYDIHPEGGIVKTEPAHKIKEEDIPKSSNSWKIATFISVVIIVGLVIFHIVGDRKKAHDLSGLEKSIAVIPFINDSPDEENAYFINGIMDELIINLQSIKDLRVPGRTSVEQYRKNPKPIPEISRELGVNYILEGSGQKYGNKFTLRVQLLEGAKGMHLWGESIDKEIESIENLSSIQSGIAISIADKLKSIITPEEKQLIEKVPTSSITANDLFQRGREEQNKFLLNNDNRDALERAEDFYYNALEYDSTFAQAYTGLAWVYWNKYYWKTFLSENFLDSALTLADIALTYDNQLSEAYLVRGRYYWHHGNKEKAINEFNKAIKINPNYGLAYVRKGSVYGEENLVKSIDNLHKGASLERGVLLPGIFRDLGFYYAASGFKEKAIYYYKEALKLDDDSLQYYYSLGHDEFNTRNYGKAIEFMNKCYAIDSNNRSVNFYLGQGHLWLDRYEEGLKYFKNVENLLKTADIKIPALLARIGNAYWVNGFRDEGEYYLKNALELHDQISELDRRQSTIAFQYYSSAAIYSVLGDEKKAYENLNLLNQRQLMPIWMVSNIKDDPMFDSIRDEPEFQQIVRDLEAKYQAEHERVRKWLEENDML
jgi:TolB-like protein